MFEAPEGSESETVERIETELAQTCGLLNATFGRVVTLIAEALEAQVWAQSGVHSPEQWVGWKCGMSAGRARQLIALARRADALPECHAALQAGELAIDQAVVVAQHAPGWADEEVTELAKVLTVPQLTRNLRRYAFDPAKDAEDAEMASDEPDAEHQAAPREVVEPERRVVHFGPVDEQRWQAFIDLPIDEGAGLETALVAAREELFHQRHPDEDDDSGAHLGDVSWADALALVAERSLAAGAVERPSIDRYQVVFHYELDPVGHPVFGPHGLPALPDALRRYWMCDGKVKPVTEIAGVPVSTGESQRIVPRRIRRLIEHRDGGCRVPGCDRSRWVQCHHIIHWEDDGPTATWNLVALCAHHHRLHHLGRLGITGNADQPDGLVFTDQRKKVLAGSGRAAPPGDPPAHTAAHPGLQIGKWQHPIGESLQPGAIHFNPPSLN